MEAERFENLGRSPGRGKAVGTEGAWDLQYVTRSLFEISDKSPVLVSLRLRDTGRVVDIEACLVPFVVLGHSQQVSLVVKEEPPWD